MECSQETTSEPVPDCFTIYFLDAKSDIDRTPTCDIQRSRSKTSWQLTDAAPPSVYPEQYSVAQRRYIVQSQINAIIVRGPGYCVRRRSKDFLPGVGYRVTILGSRETGKTISDIEPFYKVFV